MRESQTNFECREIRAHNILITLLLLTIVLLLGSTQVLIPQKLGVAEGQSPDAEPRSRAQVLIPKELGVAEEQRPKTAPKFSSFKS